MKAFESLAASDSFVARHLGPRDKDITAMLDVLGLSSLDQLVDQAVPNSICMVGELALDGPRSEVDVLEQLRSWADRNTAFRSLIGQGYYPTHVPGVIQRNILENPGWYTQYTPYQPEISQGRLEALVNYQTVITELTGLPLANSSLLDEATAAAEAMAMCHAIGAHKRMKFFVADDVHPQTLAVVRTRAEPLGIEVVTGDADSYQPTEEVSGVLLQYPGTDGALKDPRPAVARAQAVKALVVMATDLLALTVIIPPGELGADIAIGSAQRFGVPLGGGGPHAAFMSTLEAHKRFVPGRIIGVSKDARGKPAYRLALQTREQHIRRERATSNICTAQVLLANMAGMYAVYHGPEGLKRIAQRVQAVAKVFGEGLLRMGYTLPEHPVFDTVHVPLPDDKAQEILQKAAAKNINLRRLPTGLGVAFDETCELELLEQLWPLFGEPKSSASALAQEVDIALPTAFARSSDYLSHPVFHSYRSETEMLRYLKRLQNKDIALDSSMIPLGSCTMKLNATCEMVPVTWPGFANVHPFAPPEQSPGYQKLFQSLESMLAEITGFDATSLQPNAGSQGEYSGLLVIRAYHRSRGQGHRNICLIPTSAHGTNPASAVMAGMKVVPVKCNDRGDIDLEDLKTKCVTHASNLAALMVTYPSTHGVFESEIREICQYVHDGGGQVYLDGANMNAQVGLCRPGDYGADVCHLNLHKTFCIPHGGGGPGMGPICCAKHLTPFLPRHVADHDDNAVSAIAAAPFGSPSILPISWVYIAAMGGTGLKKASQVAILNANYMAARLADAFPILFRGDNGRVAHEFIIDLRPFKKTASVEAEDVAKRLMDFGFHAPTMSFPVAGTLMIEPTESEALNELDRFCEAMLAIRQEIRDVEEGRSDKADNPLKNAPHTAEVVMATEWARPYPREQAGFPLPWVRASKYWPPVARVDNAWGDRNLMCTCPPMEDFVDGTGS